MRKPIALVPDTSKVKSFSSSRNKAIQRVFGLSPEQLVSKKRSLIRALGRIAKALEERGALMTVSENSWLAFEDNPEAIEFNNENYRFWMTTYSTISFLVEDYQTVLEWGMMGKIVGSLDAKPRKAAKPVLEILDGPLPNDRVSLMEGTYLDRIRLFDAWYELTIPWIEAAGVTIDRHQLEGEQGVRLELEVKSKKAQVLFDLKLNELETQSRIFPFNENGRVPMTADPVGDFFSVVYSIMVDQLEIEIPLSQEVYREEELKPAMQDLQQSWQAELGSS